MHLTGETYASEAAGGDVHRQAFHPDSGDADLVGTVLLLHGLGDHLGCHLPAAELFCERRYLGVGVHWPGHGRSAGKRGHIMGLEPTFGLIDESLEWLDRQPHPRGIRGVYAHSTGAFLFLNYLQRQHSRRNREREGTPPLFDWIWLSSPLLRPDHGQNPVLTYTARWLAKLAPTLILDTRVRPERCRHVVPEGAKASAEMDGCHHWVSAALGADLVFHGRRINETGEAIAEPTRLLITQGEDDEICPPRFSEAFFREVGTRDKTYALLPGMRHEVMREPNNDHAVERITSWLDANQ